MDVDREKAVFGKNVNMLIQQNDWSFQRAADEIRCSRLILSRIVDGRQNFRLETAVKIARRFDISVFLMFSRLFENPEYQNAFHFVETNHMAVIRANFKAKRIKQSDVALDATTVAHLMGGRRSNPTIHTMCTLAEGVQLPLSELLKTTQDRVIEKELQEAK